jgi:Undecaprenyl-phosphate glucose phosphotransferase
MRTASDPRRSGASLEFQGASARLLDATLIVSDAVAASFWHPSGAAHPSTDAAFVASSVAFALLLFPLFGVYRSWRGRSKWQLAGHISLAWIVAQACALALMFALHRTASASRLWFVLWTLDTYASLVVSRLIVHTVLARMRHAGYDLRAVAVVGVGPHCQTVIANIVASPASGFRAVAVFNARPTEKFDTPGMLAYSDLAAFADYIRANKVLEVWLALPMSEERILLSILDEFRYDLVNIRFIPDIRSLAMFDGEMVELIGTPAINLVASPLSSSALLQKALFDRAFATVALILLSPVMIAIAIAVKVSSTGPVFFTQKRKGASGIPFLIYKFRTMRIHVEEAGVIRQATRNDPRVTRVGAFLRRTSLDELPQFLNVLRGEMSVVGPRPHATEHDNQYQKIVDGYIHRYRIKPGITGWAQVNGYRGETDRIEKMQGRVEHDLYYLRNWSFALDIRIVIATIMNGLIHRNAY